MSGPRPPSGRSKYPDHTRNARRNHVRIIPAVYIDCLKFNFCKFFLMYISKLRHLLSAAGNFHLNCGANACATNAFSFNDPDAWNSLRPRDFSERNWGKRRSGPAVWNSQKAAKNCLTPAIKCIYMLCKSTPPAKFGNPGCGQGVLLREDNPGRAFGIMENRQAISDVAKCREIGRRCACHNLRRATRAITRLYDDFLRPSGLRTNQCSTLIAAKLRGPVSLTKLAELTVTERTTLTRNLAVLLKKGLIHIEPGKDRRERLVTITQQGEEALTAAIPLWEEAQAHVENGLGDDRMISLLQHLSEIISLSREEQS